MEEAPTAMEEEDEQPPRYLRSVLVTGSNRGIGLGLVKGLAALQPPPEHVIATCRNPAEAKELQMLCKKYSNIQIMQLDVISEESRQAAVQRVGELVGENGLNCLINNAGINIEANLEKVTSEMMLEIYETNTVSPLMVAKAFLPLLRCAAKEETGMGWHRAAIINMSSNSGSIEHAEDNPLFLLVYPYRISKTALNMVTKSLAMDLQSDGILCLALHPGWVKTDMGGKDADMTVEEIIPSIISVLGRLCEFDTGTFQNWKGDIVPW